MRRPTHLAIAAVLLTAGLAGCLGQDTTPASDGDGQAPGEDGNGTFVPPKPAYEFMDAIDVNHPDHQNPRSHQAGHGFKVVGYTDFSEVYAPEQQGGWTEIDVQGHLAAVASYAGFNGITIVDISDPTTPTPLSLIPSAGDDYDARISDDGRFVFFGCQGGAGEDTMGAAGDCRGTGPQAPSEQTSGVLAYDITDPEDPAFAGFVPGVSTHNVWTDTIGGEIYVFTNGVEILRFDPGADPKAAFTQVAEVPGGHDAFVNQHPVTGEHLLYTTGNSSFAIYNVSDPADPQVLVEEGPDVTGWHKQVASAELVDGRVLLVVGGEVFRDEEGTLDGSPPPMITVLDATDPRQPEVLSQWTLPVSDLPPWVNYRFSPHNVDITPHGQVAVAWNHAGIWVFDVSTHERQDEPMTLAFHQPNRIPPARLPTVNPTGDVSTPRVWGGMWDHHGYLVVPDMYSGLYVLEPEWGLYEP